MVHNIIFVNEKEWDANHSEYPKNVFFFWDELCLLITLNNTLEALITFFGDNARKFVLIFDYVNQIANHRVFQRS
jgi:hypothetical protein